MKELLHPKDYYRNYKADDGLMMLNHDLISHICNESPVHAFEFGCGSGKHLKVLESKGVSCFGIDISPVNVLTGIAKHELPFVSIGDESHLRHLCNFDVVFTCSVLDHVHEKDFKSIVNELKRIANRAVFVAETNDVPGPYYYPHNYERYGFEKMLGEYPSQYGDGAMYYIWKWIKK